MRRRTRRPRRALHDWPPLPWLTPNTPLRPRDDPVLGVGCVTAPKRGRWLVILTAVTPAAALATFAIGLRVGAAGRIHAAVVRAAPPPAPGEALAWQVQ